MVSAHTHTHTQDEYLLIFYGSILYFRYIETILAKSGDVLNFSDTDRLK